MARTIFDMGKNIAGMAATQHGHERWLDCDECCCYWEL